MEIRRENVSFQPLSGSGPRDQSFTVVFTRNVLSAVAGIAGYSAGFEASSDRRPGEFQIVTDTSIEGNTVEVIVTFGLRDWSGEWDDDYTGFVEVVVLAELEPAVAGPTREDLQITGIEINQATQFFRSADHLDTENVRPDNSILLVEGKATGVRVYVDYDAGSGLPPVSSVSGELEVQTPTGAAVLAPTAAITPRRHLEIDRAQAAHTLNFLVDASLSRGDVTMRCRVFDASDPTQMSTAAAKTVGFVETAPLNIFVVGINYTGQGLNLPAPSLPTFLNDIALLESVYPIDGVTITGYSTIQNFAEDMKSTVGSAPGFEKLNELIADLRGDSEDIYYGALPSGGITFGPYSGASSSGVVSGVLGNPLVLAHEVGHWLGRRHAPCNWSSRCDDPASPDEDYPNYGSYASDSIGEFGYDPIADRVMDPANSFDIMGYSGINSWVSPYTYLGLMQIGESTRGGSAFRPAGVWNPIKSMTLFLSLSIDRERSVLRRPSFHFPALAHGVQGARSPFCVEFLDECRQVLGCQPLHEEICCGGCECWPRRYNPRLAFPTGARWLVIWEDRDKLYEECIPNPVSISLDCNFEPRERRFRLDWTVSDAEAAASSVWFLVQWQDGSGAWRGLMPRTQERTAFVPASLMGNRRSMRVRVLATSGIATGSNECVLVAPTERPRLPTASVVLVSDGGSAPGVDPEAALLVGARGLRAMAVDEMGRSLRDPGFNWFDQDDKELARGPSLSRRAVLAASSIRIVATNYVSRLGTIAGQWSVDRTGSVVTVRTRAD